MAKNVARQVHFRQVSQPWIFKQLLSHEDDLRFKKRLPNGDRVSAFLRSKPKHRDLIVGTIFTIYIQ